MNDDTETAWDDLMEGLGCLLYPIGVIVGLAMLGLALKLCGWAWAGL